MLLTVLIPLYQLDDDRKRNLEFIYNRLTDHYNINEIEIIFGIQDNFIDYYSKFNRAIIKNYTTDSQKFNKSHIFNRCVEDGINGDFLVFLDSDIYFPFQDLRSQLHIYHKVVRPFNECIYLDRETTETFIYKKHAVVPKGSRRIAATGGGCIILNKNILSEIKMDENFTEWGWEDIDLGNSLSKKYPIDIIYQDAVHLYHNPSLSNKNNYNYYKQKHRYYHTSYNKTKKTDIEIIIIYNINKKKNNLFNLINSLEHTGTPLTVAEIMHDNNEPLSFKRNINYIQINNTNYNIHNIIANFINRDKILFLDHDVLFDNINFIDDSSSLLDEYYIIQPFESCLWMDKNNLPLLDFNYKHSIVKAINYNRKINLGIAEYGSAWGVNKKFFNYEYLNKNPKIGYLKNCICYHTYNEYIEKTKISEKTENKGNICLNHENIVSYFKNFIMNNNVSTDRTCSIGCIY